MQVFSRYFWYLSFSLAVFSFGYATGAGKAATPLAACDAQRPQTSLSVPASAPATAAKRRPALLM